MIIIPVYFVFFAPKTQAAWWNDAWRYRKKLTIDSDQVAGELQNFPMLVSLTDTDLAAAAQSDGDDIVFTDASGNKFSHEIESYTSATGVLVAWVKIPNLTDSHDMDLYLYYGNSTAQTQQAPTDVWDSNFKMVQHMNQNPAGTAPQMLDSSENNNDGTSGGTMLTEDLVDAKIGKGLDFDGGAAADDYINVGSGDSLDDLQAQGGGGMTVSLWVRLNTGIGEGGSAKILAKGGATGEWYFQATSTGGRFNFRKIYDSTNLIARIDNAVTVEQWQYITMTWNGTATASQVKIYNNGQDTALAYTFDGANNPVTDAPNNLIIGNNNYGGETFDGIIDDVKISDKVRSSQWIGTEYNNQNSPSTFISINSQQQERPGMPVGFWPFNEGYGATTHDESGGGNTGTITGATWQQESECVSGKCLKFDGSGDEVDAGDVNY